MKGLLLPPFLLLLAFLVILLAIAAVTGLNPADNEDGDSLRWIMYLPVLMIRVYPVLLITNVIDAFIQGRLRKPWVSIAFAGGMLASIDCLLVVKVEGVIGYVFLILCSFVGVALMNWWRNRMIATVSNSDAQNGEAG